MQTGSLADEVCEWCQFSEVEDERVNLKSFTVWGVSCLLSKFCSSCYLCKLFRYDLAQFIPKNIVSRRGDRKYGWNGIWKRKVWCPFWILIKMGIPNKWCYLDSYWIWRSSISLCWEILKARCILTPFKIILFYIHILNTPLSFVIRLKYFVKRLLCTWPVGLWLMNHIVWVVLLPLFLTVWMLIYVRHTKSHSCTSLCTFELRGASYTLKILCSFITFKLFLLYYYICSQYKKVLL